jgi:hypothetical protein
MEQEIWELVNINQAYSNYLLNVFIFIYENPVIFILFL